MKKLLLLGLLVALPALAARDGAGNYVLANPSVSAGQVVTSAIWNGNFNDLATEMQDSLSRSGKGGMLVGFKFTDGTAGAPGLTFTNELTTGLYRAGATDVRLSLLGNDTLKATPTGLFYSTGGGTPALWKVPNFFDLMMFFPGKMFNGQLLARLAFSSSTTVQANLPAFVGFAGAAANASTVVILNKRAAGGVTTQIGTLTWAAAGTVPTVSYLADVNFAAGDFLEVKGPATADTTLADVTVTIQARRL